MSCRQTFKIQCSLVGIKNFLRLVLFEYFFPASLHLRSYTWKVCILRFSVKLYPSNALPGFLPAQPAVNSFKISPKSLPKCSTFSFSAAQLILLSLDCIDSRQSFKAISTSFLFPLFSFLCRH
ncbi:hypothetical protein MXB_1231 [Myxobolus squamalis]|nr:hypothetical protein MXB_1231 [Myxobolus squamalis]